LIVLRKWSANNPGIVGLDIQISAVDQHDIKRLGCGDPNTPENSILHIVAGVFAWWRFKGGHFYSSMA
jgi:hypothetical protein